MRTLLLVLLLAGCAPADRWTREDAGHDLGSDGAACRYLAGPPSDGLIGAFRGLDFDRCMRERGWRNKW